MKKSFLALASLMLVVASCVKEDTSKTPEIQENSPRTMASFYEQNRQDNTQTFIVNANEDISVTGKKGSTLTIPANNFLDASGEIVQGNVEISLIEITTKAEMILMNKPTVTENGEALESGGEFYVNVTLPGKDETLRQVELMKLDVPAENPDADMKLWRDNGNGWFLDEVDERSPDGKLQRYEEGYIIELESGWVNLDKITELGEELTTLNILVPEESDPASTSVFISPDGNPTIFIVEDIYYNGYNAYECPSVPVGLPIHIGVIQMDPGSGNLWYDIQPLVIPVAGSANFTTLYYGSISSLNADIAALP